MRCKELDAVNGTLLSYKIKNTGGQKMHFHKYKTPLRYTRFIFLPGDGIRTRNPCTVFIARQNFSVKLRRKQLKVEQLKKENL